MPAPPKRTGALLFFAAFLLLVVTVLVLVVLVVSRDSEEPVSTLPLVRFQVPLPAGTQTRLIDLRSHVAVSPDGSRLVLLAAEAGEPLQLYLRELSSLSIERLEGTEGAASPAFSADGRSLLYTVRGRVMRFDLPAGPPREVGRGTSIGQSMTGLDDGSILVTQLQKLVRIPKNSVESEVVLVEPEEGMIFLAPSAIRGTQRFSYLALHFQRDFSEVRIGSLDPSKTDRTQILPGIEGGFVHVLASGMVVFSAKGRLLAQRFDPAKLEPLDEPVVLAEGIQMFRNITAEVAVTEDVLVYRQGRDVERMIWVDRDGRELEPLGEPGDYKNFRLSPAQDRLAVTIFEQLDQADLWIFDLDRGVPTRFSSSPGPKWYPVWVDDGLVYSAKTSGPPLLWLHREGESVAKLLPSSRRFASFALDVTSDGRILFGQDSFFGFKLLGLGDDKPTDLMTGQHDVDEARLSQDKRWLAFGGSETGRSEIYLIHLDHPEIRKRVSIDGGRAPRWRGDGHELFFKAPDGQVMAVPVTLDDGKALDRVNGAVIGTPTPLFAADPRRADAYEVTSDGQRFLVLQVEKDANEAPFTVVLGWQHLLTSP